MRYLVDRVKTVIYLVARVLGGVGAGVIVALALFTTAGATMRYAFNRPILGDFELTQLTLAVVVACVLAYTQVKKSHVVLDLVMSRFSQRTQSVIDNIVRLLAVGITSLITWQSVVQARAQILTGLYSPSLFTPIYPFLFVTAVGWGVLCLVYLVELTHSLLGSQEK